MQSEEYTFTLSETKKFAVICTPLETLIQTNIIEGYGANPTIQESLNRFNNSQGEIQSFANNQQMFSFLIAALEEWAGAKNLTFIENEDDSSFSFSIGEYTSPHSFRTEIAALTAAFNEFGFSEFLAQNNIAPEKKLCNAPDELKPNEAIWSYQIDGCCMDVIAPNNMLTRIIQKDGELSFQLMTYTQQAELDNDDYKASITDPKFKMEDLSLLVTDDNRVATISLRPFTEEPDSLFATITFTDEGIIVDVWEADENDDEENILTLGAMPQDFDE
jgi:hypothetical protein